MFVVVCSNVILQLLETSSLS